MCFLESPVSGQRTGAWSCPRLCPWKLLPGNRWPLGWSRDELESFIHLWPAEERTLLHCQPSAGRANTSSHRLWDTFIHTLFLWRADPFHFWPLTLFRKRRSVSTVIHGDLMILIPTPWVTALRMSSPPSNHTARSPGGSLRMVREQELP